MPDVLDAIGLQGFNLGTEIGVVVNAETEFTSLYKFGMVGGDKKDEIVLATYSRNDQARTWFNLHKYATEG